MGYGPGRVATTGGGFVAAPVKKRRFRRLKFVVRRGEPRFERDYLVGDPVDLLAVPDRRGLRLAELVPKLPVGVLKVRRLHPLPRVACTTGCKRRAAQPPPFGVLDEAAGVPPAAPPGALLVELVPLAAPDFIRFDFFMVPMPVLPRVPDADMLDDGAPCIVPDDIEPVVEFAGVDDVPGMVPVPVVVPDLLPALPVLPVPDVGPAGVAG